MAITSPATGTNTAASSITVTGTSSDALAGVVSVKVNNVAATTSNGFATWTATAPLGFGTTAITATATDRAGNFTTTAPVLVNETAAQGAPPAGVSRLSERIRTVFGEEMVESRQFREGMHHFSEPKTLSLSKGLSKGFGIKCHVFARGRLDARRQLDRIAPSIPLEPVEAMAGILQIMQSVHRVRCALIASEGAEGPELVEGFRDRMPRFHPDRVAGIAPPMPRGVAPVQGVGVPPPRVSRLSGRFVVFENSPPASRPPGSRSASPIFTTVPGVRSEGRLMASAFSAEGKIRTGSSLLIPPLQHHFSQHLHESCSTR